MEKKYYYLVEQSKNSANINYRLQVSSLNMDKEPGYYRITKKLAASLCNRIPFKDYDYCADIRIESGNIISKIL